MRWIAALAALLFALPASAAPMFLPLGVSSYAYDVSADALVAVGARGGAGEREAFRWTASEGPIGLGAPPGYNESGANAASADGSVIVGRLDGGGFTYEAFRWNADEGIVGLGVPSGYSNSIARDVSADGSAIVGSLSGNYSRAYRWTAEAGVVALDLPLGATSSDAYAVSGDGTVVVGSALLNPTAGELSSHQEAFRWTADEGSIALGFLPGNSLSYGLGISSDGSVVVGYSSDNVRDIQAFRWTEEDGMVGLGYLAGYDRSWATDASADGSVIVGVAEDSFGSGSRATIWDPTYGMRSLQAVLKYSNGLDLSGWTLDATFAVSADGRTIVGAGYNPSGQLEGWIATDIMLIPEPGTGLLVAVGVIGVAASRRGRPRR